MKDFEEKRPRPWFVQIPLELLFDVNSVSDKAFRLYCVLQSYSFRGSFVFPSVGRLAKDLGISRVWVQKLLRQLEKTGWISRQLQPGTVSITAIYNPSVEMAQSSELRDKSNTRRGLTTVSRGANCSLHQGLTTVSPELEDPYNDKASLTRSKKKERKEPNSREPDPLPIETTPERIEYLESLAGPAGERPPAAGARRNEKKVKGDLKKIDGIMKEAGLK